MLLTALTAAQGATRKFFDDYPLWRAPETQDASGATPFEIELRALLERAGGGSAATNRVALLGCSRQDTLQKELTEHAVYLVLQTGMLLPPSLVSGR